MGKRSRRKAQKAREGRDQTENETGILKVNRFRPSEQYNADDGVRHTLLLEQFSASEMAGLRVRDEKQTEIMAEYMYLVVFQANKKKGLEAALRAARRWPSFSPHWRRVRRRICEYCGRRKSLSEPRLWVCSGCGVARYCDEECQANDSWHHGNCCFNLAREWNGVGPMPSSLFPLVVSGGWKSPAALPSARARERLDEWVKRNPELLRARALLFSSGEGPGKGL